jgi:hypothetical protein
MKFLRKSKNPGAEFFQTRILWDDYTRNFDDLRDAALYPAISALLLQRVMPMNENELAKYTDDSSRLKRIESMTIRLMGTPEYQLC